MIAQFLKWLLSFFDRTVADDLDRGADLDQGEAALFAEAQAVKAIPTAKLRVPGKEIALAGVVYVIAPLNAAAVKQYRDQVKKVFVGGLPDIELVSKLAFASLQRNYPDITMAKVEQIIDYSNYFTVWEEMLNLSGLVAQAGEMVRRVQAQMQTQGLTP